MEIANDHVYVKDLEGPKLSGLLKEKLVYIGQLDTYERGSQIAKKLLNVDTNDTAIYRLTDRTGEVCSSLLSEHQSLETEAPKGEDEVINIEVDGSMILTREDSWREVKLGRIFRMSPGQDIDNQIYMSESEYVAHLGSHKIFRAKMDRLLSCCPNKKVFINDGAKWIEKWIAEHYPDAVQILDFFHAMKHISEYLEVQYGVGQQKKDMSEYWGHILKTEGVAELKKTSQERTCQNKESKTS